MNERQQGQSTRLVIRSAWSLNLVYVVVVLLIGLIVVAWGWDIFTEFRQLERPAAVWEDSNLLWSIFMLLLAGLVWPVISMRIILDFLSGRPLAVIDGNGITARLMAIPPRFERVEWSCVTSVSDPRASGRSISFAALLPFRILVEFERSAEKKSVISAVRAKRRSLPRSGKLKIPTSYANKTGREIKAAIDVYWDDCSGSDTDDENAEPFTSLTDGTTFRQELVLKQSAKPSLSLKQPLADNRSGDRTSD